MTNFLMQLTERKMVAQMVVQMVVQTVAQARHVAHHVAVDAIQVVIVVQHRLPVPIALIVAVVDVILDVVEDVMAVVLLIVKVVVVQDAQAVVAHHVLERVKKVAKHLVLANAEDLHVLAFVQILVTEVSVMIVVQGHANLRAKEPAFILVI